MALSYWGTVSVVVPIIGIVVATSVYLLRLYVRRHGKLDVGDLFMGLGLLFCYGYTIITVWTAFNGIGYDINSLPPETRERVSLLFWISQKFWPPSQMFVKLSIIILLRKVFGTVDGMLTITTCIIVFSIAWTLTALMGNTFQCWPPQYFWRFESIQGSCIAGQPIFYTCIGAMSLMEDVILLLIPILNVWRLHMPTEQKTALTILFSVGVLVCVFSLLRLVYFKSYRTQNLTVYGGKEGLWSVLELDIAIICASLVLMGHLFNPFLKKCRRFCCFRRKRPSDSTESFEPSRNDIVFLTNTRCSEVRADACYVPSPVITAQDGPALSFRDIMVETSIGRSVSHYENSLDSKRRRTIG